MKVSLRMLALATLLAAGAFAAVPAAAEEECAGMRQFSGLVQGLKKGDKGQLVVDNRMGDKVKFVRDATSTVSDQTGGNRNDWDSLKNGDYVSVCWKFTDNPRKAYKIYVKPVPAESAEEE
jgi:hypothetical protein